MSAIQTGGNRIRGSATWARAGLATATLLGIAPMLILLSIPVVFDLSRPALIFDDENRNDRPVAAGPRPRMLICYPSYHDFFFAGTEWPFRVYSPLCRVWRRAHGYVAPSGGSATD
jgi:hypothetical protein